MEACPLILLWGGVTGFEPELCKTHPLPMLLPIYYRDEHCLVVDKPSGLPIHKNAHLAHDAPYLTKLLGDHLGQWVYNVHRLDAKTSGLVLLALSPEAARNLTQQFEQRRVEKIYHAILKGDPGQGCWEEPVLDRKKGKRKPARTDYRALESVLTPLKSKDRSPVSLCLTELRPYTGRWHQLRQHCAYHRFDIVGDTQHGDWTLNRLITEATGSNRLLLHAQSLAFDHPQTGERMVVRSEHPVEFRQVLDHWCK
ncbi:MAG: hypothetical protein D6772_13740 [Bacteroidetes bacterium]|nr:MAG: hypothetical protein D6772_13740 [Bacteroidota bacterium]